MISVQNSTAHDIDVAISRWGGAGRTGYFRIRPQQRETWDRRDLRGFVMSLSREGTAQPYFVLHYSQIVVLDEDVTDHGEHINPIGPALVLGDSLDLESDSLLEEGSR